MSRLDEVKEMLTTLRVAMSLSFGMLIVTINGIIKRIDNGVIDYIFWYGVVFVFFLLMLIVVLIINISRKTKEIRGL